MISGSWGAISYQPRIILKFWNFGVFLEPEKWCIFLAQVGQVKIQKIRPHHKWDLPPKVSSNKPKNEAQVLLLGGLGQGVHKKRGPRGVGASGWSRGRGGWGGSCEQARCLLFHQRAHLQTKTGSGWWDVGWMLVYIPLENRWGTSHGEAEHPCHWECWSAGERLPVWRGPSDWSPSRAGNGSGEPAVPRWRGLHLQHEGDRRLVGTCWVF